MSLNLFLIQLVLFTCIFMLFQASRLPRGWLVVIGVLLSILGGSYLYLPNRAGWISGLFWGLLLLLPLTGIASINRLVSKEKYGQASRIAWFIRWLHPTDGFWEYPVLLWAMELGQKGQLTDARELLGRYQDRATAVGRAAMAFGYRLEARWDELLAWTQTLPWAQTDAFEKRLFQESSLASLYLRSLGETGDLNGLLRAVNQFEQQSSKTGNTATFSLVRLYALAFCGYVESLQVLLNGPLSLYPESTRQFWRLTAELVTESVPEKGLGNAQIIRDQLLALRDRSPLPQQRAIDWRLSHPCPNPDQELLDFGKQLLFQIDAAVWQDAQYSHGKVGHGKMGYGSAIAPEKNLATQTLIGINSFVFALEVVSGGSQDLEVLYRLGALVPQDVWAGEWWRVFNAIFLHAGIVHLLANMLGLYVFGKRVESVLGIRKFLLGYFTCGIGSMLTVTILAILTQAPVQVTVGASGAIMGLVGIEMAILLKSWHRDKGKYARDRLRLILMVTGLQIISDLLTPQVSVIGHFSGLTLGLLIGSIL